MTKIIDVNPEKPNKKEIAVAAEILKKGGTVAFPTETVYGLGASALSQKAVLKIFKAKGRPQDNPLIVHVARIEDIKPLVTNIPDIAKKLMKHFFPGPLTLIFKKSQKIPDSVSAGLPTVAVRVPDHPVAHLLLKTAGIPVAAPSANASGKPSTTTAAHVIHDLSGKIDAIIDGGSSRVGVESTVLDVTKSPPMLLRPGGVSREAIEDIIGPIQVHHSLDKKITRNFKASSPGMKYRHYAPNARVCIIDRNAEKIDSAVNKYLQQKLKVGVLTTNKGYRHPHARVRYFGNNPEQNAYLLFKILRSFDDKKMDIILVERIPNIGLGLAIMNRVQKAAQR